MVVKVTVRCATGHPDWLSVHLPGAPGGTAPLLHPGPPQHVQQGPGVPDHARRGVCDRGASAGLPGAAGLGGAGRGGQRAAPAHGRECQVVRAELIDPPHPHQLHTPPPPPPYHAQAPSSVYPPLIGLLPCSYRACERFYEKKRHFVKVLSCYWRDPKRKVGHGRMGVGCRRMGVGPWEDGGGAGYHWLC